MLISMEPGFSFKREKKHPAQPIMKDIKSPAGELSKFSAHKQTSCTCLCHCFKLTWKAQAVEFLKFLSCFLMLRDLSFTVLFILKNLNYFYCSYPFDLCAIFAETFQTTPTFIYFLRSQRREFVPDKQEKGGVWGGGGEEHSSQVTF